MVARWTWFRVSTICALTLLGVLTCPPLVPIPRRVAPIRRRDHGPEAPVLPAPSELAVLVVLVVVVVLLLPSVLLVPCAKVAICWRSALAVAATLSLLVAICWRLLTLATAAAFATAT